MIVSIAIAILYYWIFFCSTPKEGHIVKAHTVQALSSVSLPLYLLLKLAVLQVFAVVYQILCKIVAVCQMLRKTVAVCQMLYKTAAVYQMLRKTAAVYQMLCKTAAVYQMLCKIAAVYQIAAV